MYYTIFGIFVRHTTFEQGATDAKRAQKIKQDFALLHRVPGVAHFFVTIYTLTQAYVSHFLVPHFRQLLLCFLIILNILVSYFNIVF